MFKAGDAVVCIGIDNIDEEDFTVVECPKVGEILEVRDVCPDDSYISFMEYDTFYDYVYFNPRCFRKAEYYTAKHNEVNFNFIEEGLEMPCEEKVLKGV